MKKKLMLAVVFASLLIFAVKVRSQETNSISWTNGGSASGSCLVILTVDNRPVTGTYAYCPNQSTEFAYPDGKASLYLPDFDTGEFGLILEGITVFKGNIIPLTFNPDGSILTFQRTDTFAEKGWTGQVTQKYANRVYYGARNRKLIRVVYLGGFGTVTENN